MDFWRRIPSPEAELGRRGPGRSGLGAAFSLRHNWHQLTIPSPTALRPVDGLRALSFLWVFLFHVCFFTSLHLSPQAFGELLARPALRLVCCGDLGVDVFFTISGFLIASLLLQELAATGNLAVGRFYGRRALRLMPAYLAVLALYCKLGFPRCATAWANVLYVNNFLPMSRQCMAWSWSLAVEEQFYLVCPLLLLFLYGRPPRARLPLLVVSIAAATVGSFWVVLTRGIALPVPVSEVLYSERARQYFDVLYDKTQVRCGALLIGVLAAFLRQHTGFVRALPRHPRLVAAGLVGATLLLAAICLYPARDPMLTGAPRWLQVVYLAGFRYTVAAGVAYVLLLSLGEHPAGKVLGRLLSHRAFFPIAQLSYAAYLLHPIVIIGMYALVPPPESLSNYALVGYTAAALLATLLCAAALYFVLERPLINLRALWWPAPRSAAAAARPELPVHHPRAPGKKS